MLSEVQTFLAVYGSARRAASSRSAWSAWYKVTSKVAMPKHEHVVHPRTRACLVESDVQDAER